MDASPALSDSSYIQAQLDTYHHSYRLPNLASQLNFADLSRGGTPPAKLPISADTRYVDLLALSLIDAHEANDRQLIRLLATVIDRHIKGTYSPQAHLERMTLVLDDILSAISPYLSDRVKARQPCGGTAAPDTPREVPDAKQACRR